MPPSSKGSVAGTGTTETFVTGTNELPPLLGIKSKRSKLLEPPPEVLTETETA